MPNWIQPALAYVSSWLELQVRHAQLPGLSLAVAERGRVVRERAYGVANAATGEALTPEHRFRVASHSKTFTAAAVMKLR
jgi:CubicO group peptidase (beta-lactamase class C family)